MNTATIILTDPSNPYTEWRGESRWSYTGLSINLDKINKKIIVKNGEAESGFDIEDSLNDSTAVENQKLEAYEQQLRELLAPKFNLVKKEWFDICCQLADVMRSPKGYFASDMGWAKEGDVIHNYFGNNQDALVLKIVMPKPYGLRNVTLRNAVTLEEKETVQDPVWACNLAVK